MTAALGATPAPKLEKPTAAFILGLLGGIFMLIGSFVIFSIALATVVVFSFFGLNAASLLALAAVGLIVAVAMIVFSVLMYLRPQDHVVFGVLVLVLALVGFVTCFFGGFVIGMILGIIGGAIGIGHKPTPPAPVVMHVQSARMCPKCGRAIDNLVAFCPHCGNHLA